MMVAIAIRRAVLAAAVLGLVVGAAGRARADLLITFDDVQIPVGQTAVQIPYGFEGFNWTNFFVATSGFLSTINTPPEVSGVHSPEQAAFLAGNASSAELTSTGGTTFDLTSAFLTSFNVPQSVMSQTVRVQGFLKGQPITADDVTYNITNLAPLAPTPVTFDPENLGLFKGIDEAKFTSGGNYQFVMDNLLLNGPPPASNVPELDAFSTASALTLLTSGVLILNGRRKR
jgi:hypothetical protein